jgi:hypothetical protein
MKFKSIGVIGLTQGETDAIVSEGLTCMSELHKPKKGEKWVAL